MKRREMDLRILREARDYLANHGWIRGQEEDEAGNVCARGAIKRAIMKINRAEPWNYPAYAAGAEHFLLCSMRNHGVLTGSVPGFNDAYDTTKDDVMQAFDWAIEDAETELGIDETNPHVLARVIQEANSPVVQVLAMDATVEAMEIGKEGEPYTAEPAEEIPGVEREKVSEPTPEPVEPEKVPT